MKSGEIQQGFRELTSNNHKQTSLLVGIPLLGIGALLIWPVFANETDWIAPSTTSLLLWPLSCLVLATGSIVLTRSWHQTMFPGARWLAAGVVVFGWTLPLLASSPIAYSVSFASQVMAIALPLLAWKKWERIGWLSAWTTVAILLDRQTIPYPLMDVGYATPVLLYLPSWSSLVGLWLGTPWEWSWPEKKKQLVVTMAATLVALLVVATRLLEGSSSALPLGGVGLAIGVAVPLFGFGTGLLLGVPVRFWRLFLVWCGLLVALLKLPTLLVNGSMMGQDLADIYGNQEWATFLGAMVVIVAVYATIATSLYWGGYRLGAGRPQK